MNDQPAARRRYLVVIRFAARNGAEWVGAEQVEAASPEAAVEIAGLRGSRGHGGLRPAETVSVSLVPSRRDNGPGTP